MLHWSILPCSNSSGATTQPTWHLNDHKQVRKWKNAQKVPDAKFTLGMDPIRPKSSGI